MFAPQTSVLFGQTGGAHQPGWPSLQPCKPGVQDVLPVQHHPALPVHPFSLIATSLVPPLPFFISLFSCMPLLVSYTENLG